MKKQSFLRTIALILLLTMLLSSIGFAAESKEKTPEELYKQYEVLKQLYFDTNHEPSTSEELLDGFMKNLLEKYPEKYSELMDLFLSSTDQYGGYFTEQEYKNAYGFSGRYAGIGVQVGMKDEFVVIEEIYDGPAKNVGLKVGDKIVSVDGVDTTWADISEIGDLVRGEEGTTLKMTVIRPGVLNPIEVELIRQRIKLSAIEWEYLGEDKENPEDIGYIKITGFDDYYTYVDFYYAMNRFYNSKTEKLIIDVRDNRGGELDALVNILNVLCPDGDKLFFTVKYNNDQTQKIYGNNFHIPYKQLIVLANENSYSAAEVFAGTIKDLGLGKVLGKKTHGKGVGQTHSTVFGSDTAVISTMDIILPKTGSYNGIGVSPDIEVTNAKVKADLPYLPPMKYVSDVSVGFGGDVVLGVETYLNVLGYLTNEPNIYFDKRSEGALKRFQKDMGITADGVINKTTIENLYKAMAAVREMAVTKDTQLQKALELLK